MYVGKYTSCPMDPHGYGKHDGHHGKAWVPCPMSLNFQKLQKPLEVPHGPTPDSVGVEEQEGLLGYIIMGI